MEEIDRDQINTWSDSECAKKEAKRDKRTQCACKAADLESGHLSRDQKEDREGALSISEACGSRESQDQVQMPRVGMYLLCSWNEKETSVRGVGRRSQSGCPREPNHRRALGHSQDSGFYSE